VVLNPQKGELRPSEKSGTSDKGQGTRENIVVSGLLMIVVLLTLILTQINKL